MYPVRDFAAELYGFAAGDEWIIPPSFETAYSFCRKRAYIKKSDGTHWFLDFDLRLTSLDEIANRAVPKSKIKEIVVGEDQSEKFACLLTVEHRRELSFIYVDLELRPTILKTIPKKTKYLFHEEYGWAILRIDESKKRTYSTFHPQTFAEIVLPEYKTFYTSRDGHWVAVAKNANDDPKDKYITLGHTDQYAFFSIDSLERISDWHFFASPFNEGLGLLCTSDKQCHFIDHEIKLVEGLEFHHADDFRHGLAAAERENESGFFGKDGKLVIPLDPSYETMKFDRMGHAFISSPDQKRHLIDRNGNFLVSDLATCDFFDGDFFYYEITYEWHELWESILLKPDLSAAVNLPPTKPKWA